MPSTKEKTKAKSKKAVIIFFSVLAVIVIAAVIFISIMTKPVSADSKNAVPVGGLIVSDSVNYQEHSDKKLASNPIIKIMQMSWKFCAASDTKAHEKQNPPQNIKKIKDVAYIDDANLYHLLDIYYPEGTTKKLPVIIDIHGGGWMYGNKDLNENYCLSLADRGYVVFNMSYRLVPDVTVNEQLQDVMCALKWIGENMNSYPCDMKNIMLTGDSAGGQLAAYAAVLLQSGELREIFDVAEADLDITALMLTSPVPYMNSSDMMSIYTKILWGTDYKKKATYQYMNLDQIIDYAQLPPTYLITSSGDTLAHGQTNKTAELLKSKNMECKLADYGKSDGKKLVHVFSVINPFDKAGKTAIDEAIRFYEDIIEKNK